MNAAGIKKLLSSFADLHLIVSVLRGMAGKEAPGPNATAEEKMAYGFFSKEDNRLMHYVIQLVDAKRPGSEDLIYRCIDWAFPMHEVPFPFSLLVKIQRERFVSHVMQMPTPKQSVTGKFKIDSKEKIDDDTTLSSEIIGNVEKSNYYSTQVKFFLHMVRIINGEDHDAYGAVGQPLIAGPDGVYFADPEDRYKEVLEWFRKTDVPHVSYDGLRRMRNLPKNIKVTLADLFAEFEATATKAETSMAKAADAAEARLDAGRKRRASKKYLPGERLLAWLFGIRL